MKYNIQKNVGKAKYIVNYYEGKKHGDGSDFYDIKIFKNKKKMNEFIKMMKEKTERREIIAEIWELSSDEFEKPIDVLDFAVETIGELKERLHGIKEYLKVNF